MKQLYQFLLVCICLSSLPAQAQNWRPFRPNGDVHAFRNAAADTVLTLRLDSAAVQGTDSVYYFNRIMRRSNSFSWRKSVNNQFGRQLRYNVAQRTYVLFWNGGTTPVGTLDVALVLKPFVPVGTSWTSANTDVGMPTTLLSRGISQIDGVTDSIATFRVGSSLTVVLSKNNGLVSAPQDLRIGSPAPRMLTLARRPDAAGRSYYNPLTLVDLQVGDELGYEFEPVNHSGLPCYRGWLLRRVLSRQITADSIIYTFRQQERTNYFNPPGCFNSGSTMSPVSVIRISASRRTGQWVSSSSILKLNYTTLLAYEYRQEAPIGSAVTMGQPVVTNRVAGLCGTPVKLVQTRLYRNGGTANEYRPGLDMLAWGSATGEAVGVMAQYEHYLTYYQRTVNGTPQTCGNRTEFATLLPVKAARAAATFRLHPNPAPAAATLTLAQPARAATTVRLIDGMGRIVHTQPLPAGQTTATLALQGLATGLYIVEVQAPGEAAQHLRLEHQQ
ncbi:Por secretion system C-terminal sorting domain-containing protein [Hymenobacter daecheongensis DSM 21074]|uniref:Por secretion system C-terminal sorting domain-containing protein n=1 Tax=Hymenobacter daecheongensis DSM 21074 TaxID=1121955 RepID=A0A1M6GLQ0_9BACT|nr:T9SS type A sorting domain-containing protein [Hymenobacter daecheongensis]SHJ10880.1 Por secretion system C-terminal sorting domain-containing protein [Hymenobacter daecheongensis DSM 21074]